jgi:hypothetical protein
MGPLKSLCEARRLLAEEDERNGQLEIDWDTDSQLTLEHGRALLNEAAALTRQTRDFPWRFGTVATFDEQGPQRPPGDDFAVAGTNASFDELRKICNEAKALQEQLERRNAIDSIVGAGRGVAEMDPFLYMDKVVEYLEGETMPKLAKMLPPTPPKSSEAEAKSREEKRVVERYRTHARLLHSRLIDLSTGEEGEVEQDPSPTDSLAEHGVIQWVRSWL